MNRDLSAEDVRKKHLDTLGPELVQCTTPFTINVLGYISNGSNT